MQRETKQKKEKIEKIDINEYKKTKVKRKEKIKDGKEKENYFSDRSIAT